MKKSVFIVVAFCMTSITTNISFKNQRRIANIVYLDEDVSEMNNRKYKNDKKGAILLDEKVEGYVFNKESFSKLEKENANHYLKEGGVIVVTDNKVTYDDVISNFDVKTPSFDFSEDDEMYGFYLKMKDSDLNLTSVYADAIGGSEKKKIKKEVVTNDLVSLQAAVIPTLPGDGGKPKDTSGQVIATGFCQTLLYHSAKPDLFMCSYTIASEVIDVLKAIDGSGVRRGIYDVQASIFVDPTPNYRLRGIDMGIKVNDNLKIIEGAYFHNRCTSDIFFESTISPIKQILSGDAYDGVDFTYDANRQEYINSISDDVRNDWTSTIKYGEFGEDFTFRPAVRTVDKYEFDTSYAITVVENIEVRDILTLKYTMDRKNKRGVKISWNSDGMISQELIRGVRVLYI